MGIKFLIQTTTLANFESAILMLKNEQKSSASKQGKTRGDCTRAERLAAEKCRFNSVIGEVNFSSAHVPEISFVRGGVGWSGVWGGSDSKEEVWSQQRETG